MVFSILRILPLEEVVDLESRLHVRVQSAHGQTYVYYDTWF